MGYKRSSTYSSEIKLVPTSKLSCECGWKGTLRKAKSIIRKDEHGHMRNEAFLCPKESCLLLLASWSRKRYEKEMSKKAAIDAETARRAALLKKIRTK